MIGSTFHRHYQRKCIKESWYNTDIMCTWLTNILFLLWLSLSNSIITNQLLSTLDRPLLFPRPHLLLFLLNSNENLSNQFRRLPCNIEHVLVWNVSKVMEVLLCINLLLTLTSCIRICFQSKINSPCASVWHQTNFFPTNWMIMILSLLS